jgi:hypothetical protein
MNKIRFFGGVSPIGAFFGIDSGQRQRRGGEETKSEFGFKHNIFLCFHFYIDSSHPKCAFIFLFFDSQGGILAFEIYLLQ